MNFILSNISKCVLILGNSNVYLVYQAEHDFHDFCLFHYPAALAKVSCHLFYLLSTAWCSENLGPHLQLRVFHACGLFLEQCAEYCTWLPSFA